MKHTKVVALLVSLLAVGLGLGCDSATPTQTELPVTNGSVEQNWRLPPPCPPGTSPQFAHNCIPQVPPPRKPSQPPA